eukprot:1618929-Rhodomonas_salina.1
MATTLVRNQFTHRLENRKTSKRLILYYSQDSSTCSTRLLSGHQAAGPGTGSTLVEQPGTTSCTRKPRKFWKSHTFDESESRIGAERLAHLCK